MFVWEESAIVCIVFVKVNMNMNMTLPYRHSTLANPCQPLPTSILTVTSTTIVTPPSQRALEETARTLARLASSPKNIEKLYESGMLSWLHPLGYPLG